MNKKQQLDLIVRLLSQWNSMVQLHNAISHYDINVLSEGLAAELLNIIYGLKLTNLNEKKDNFPGLDLGDEKAKKAFQVTSRTDSRKILETLERVQKNKHDKIYKNGIYFFVLTESKEKIRFGKASINKYSFFNRDENILTFRDIIKKVKSLYDSDKQKFDLVTNVLKREFGNKHERVEDEDIPCIHFSFQNLFHLQENAEELSVHFQDASRRYEQKRDIIFEIEIIEEAILLDQVKELKKKSKTIENKRMISEINDILFGVSKIKKEILFKLKALVIVKNVLGYKHYDFGILSTAFHELMKDLWEAQLIMVETNIGKILNTKYSKEKTERLKGNATLWIDCDNGFGFSIYEEKEVIECVFQKFHETFSLSSDDDVRSSKFWGVDVSNLTFGTIIRKVIPGFIDELYRQGKELDEIEGIHLQDKIISIG